MLEILLTCTMSFINIFLLLSQSLYLFIKRSEFPYSNISPIWIIITLSSLSINQLFAQTSFLSNVGITSDNPPELNSQKINFLYVHNLIVIPLLARIYSLSQSIKYNYHHISRKFYDENFQNEMDEHFKAKYYKRNFYYLKSFILPLMAVFMLVSILWALPYTNCALNSAILSQFKLKLLTCNGVVLDNDLQYEYEIAGCLMINIYLMIEICLFMTVLYNVFKYPIENDKFYLKFEFFSVFVVWITTHNFLLGSTYIFEDFSLHMSSVFMVNSVRVFLIAVIYLFVTVKRKSLCNKEMKNVVRDFDSFMYCNVGFTFFKEFIRNYYEDDYKLLSFWIEYHLYKKQTQLFQENVQQMYYKNNEEHRVRTSSVKSCNLSLNTQEKLLVNQYEDQLREMAEAIYADYFLQSRNNSNSPSCNYLQIEFPVDIYEKIDDASKKNFNVENLMEIFDESYSFVTSKLYNLFIHFCRNRNEFNKLERVFFFIDFYEIKRITFS